MNLKDGMKVRVVARPPSVDLDDVEVTSSAKADAILVFIKTLADVDKRCAPAVEAAKQDRLAWIAYPEATQLGTDLNRDILWRHLLKEHIRASVKSRSTTCGARCASGRRSEARSRLNGQNRHGADLDQTESEGRDKRPLPYVNGRRPPARATLI